MFHKNKSCITYNVTCQLLHNYHFKYSIIYIYIYIYIIYILYIYIIYNYKQVIRKKFGKGAKKISKMEAQGLPSSSRIEIFFAPFAKKPS